LNLPVYYPKYDLKGRPMGEADCPPGGDPKIWEFAMRTSGTVTLLCLAMLVLVLATPVMAQEAEVETKDRNDESNECNCSETPSCCDLDDELPNGDFKCGYETILGCDIVDPNGNIDLELCVLELGSFPAAYSVTKILDGIRISYSNGDPLSCVGFKENVPGIGKIKLRHPVAGKVAKIHKFVEDPTGASGENPLPTAVYIQINLDSFTVPTSIMGNLLDKDELNNLIESTIATKYNITANGNPYWIVTSNKTTGEYINLVSVRADDEGLIAMDLELRPARFNQADYDTPCGEVGH
jgi:hypothetical protein